MLMSGICSRNQRIKLVKFAFSVVSSNRSNFVCYVTLTTVFGPQFPNLLNEKMRHSVSQTPSNRTILYHQSCPGAPSANLLYLTDGGAVPPFHTLDCAS